MKYRKRAVLLMALMVLAVAMVPWFAMADDVPLYTAYMSMDASIRQEKDRDSKSLGMFPERSKIEIYEVDPTWVTVRKNGVTGYVLRTTIERVEAVDPVNTPPYGVEKFMYRAVVAKDTEIKKAKDSAADGYITLHPGANIAIIGMEDGWAKIIYHRSYAYIDTRDLTDLVPVSATDAPYSEETPIAAYTSYYNIVTTEINLNRIDNIHLACSRLSRVLEPGEVLNFNENIGPWRRSLGYKEAPVLINGEVKPGFGGGTCQVSSTFYNIVLQLPGIEVIHRRPHGPSGASYLPHGVDAAVGNDTLNLIITNSYDFPIRIEANAQDGALFMCVYKVQ